MSNIVVDTGKERAAVLRMLKKILGENYQTVGNFSSLWINNASCHHISLKKNYTLLRQVGLSDRQISRNVILLVLPTRTVKQSYEFLRGKGLSDKAIASDPQLLSLNLETLKRNYNDLSRIGLAAELARHPTLLHRNPETLEKNYKLLRAKGLKHEKVVRNALLLASNPETLRRNWSYLRRKGLSDAKIATNAHLLQLRPDNIARNYYNLRRFFAKDKIATFATLLGIPPETVISNVQFMVFLRIDYEKYTFTCMSSTSIKRKKIAWLMKNLFGSTNIHESLRKVRQLIRKNPKLLVYSIKTLENKRESLSIKASKLSKEIN